MGYGIGGEPVIRSLGKAVPHWGLSMPSGDGKSICAELIAAQMLFHGAVVLILDYKVFSHPWALFTCRTCRMRGRRSRSTRRCCG